MINLVADTINKNDIDSLIAWLKTYPHLTKGVVTEEYEAKWAKRMGRAYAVFVNSGSSANLLMIYTLIASKMIDVGDKIVIPTLSWATDMAPAVQLGLEPVLCDCNLEDLSIDLAQFEKICKTQHPKALLLVSVLGLVPDMRKIKQLCNKYNVILLEDVCESLGSVWGNTGQLGTFGLMSSFSTYFGHHISTIEGGMVCTDDRDLYNVLKSLRSHGWDRDLDEDVRLALRDEHNIDDFSGLYTFYYPGFNLRSTDLQAFIGLGQLDKVEDIISRRRDNFNTYYTNLNVSWKPVIRANDYISNFAYPIIHENKEGIVRELQNQQVAVRPLICGSMNSQPAYKHLIGDFLNAERVNRCGFYIPNHPDLSTSDINLICNTINNNI